MIETLWTKAAPHDALTSSRQLILLENLVLRSPDKSLAAIDPLPRQRQYDDDVGNLADIIDPSAVVMNPSAVPTKVHWQNADGQIRLKKPPKHKHRRNNHLRHYQIQRLSQHLSQHLSQRLRQNHEVKPLNQAKISHLHKRMMTSNSAFASGFMPVLNIGLTRI